MKLKMVRKVSKFKSRIEYRLAIQKWQQFVISERRLDEIVIQGKEYFKEKRLVCAMAKLIENRKVKREQRSIERQIDQLLFNKQAVKIFDMFRVYLEI